MGFPREYTQVLLNILSNARDALRERETPHPKILIRVLAEGDRAVVTITDNAGGIPDPVFPRIFDLYVTTKEASGGTGIGLHMSKNIIEKNMQGSLTVHNLDSGAQFRIAVNMPGERMFRKELSVVETS
jgi:signal transduction histidine kinase